MYCCQQEHRKEREKDVMIMQGIRKKYGGNCGPYVDILAGKLTDRDRMQTWIKYSKALTYEVQNCCLKDVTN